MVTGSSFYTQIERAVDRCAALAPPLPAHTTPNASMQRNALSYPYSFAHTRSGIRSCTRVSSVCARTIVSAESTVYIDRSCAVRLHCRVRAHAMVRALRAQCQHTHTHHTQKNIKRKQAQKESRKKGNSNYNKVSPCMCMREAFHIFFSSLFSCFFMCVASNSYSPNVEHTPYCACVAHAFVSYLYNDMLALCAYRTKRTWANERMRTGAGHNAS